MVEDMKAKPVETKKTFMIVFDTLTGEISINGPLNERLLCHGMLDMARVSLEDWYRANAVKTPAGEPEGKKKSPLEIVH